MFALLLFLLVLASLLRGGCDASPITSAYPGGSCDQAVCVSPMGHALCTLPPGSAVAGDVTLCLMERNASCWAGPAPVHKRCETLEGIRSCTGMEVGTQRHTDLVRAMSRRFCMEHKGSCPDFPQEQDFTLECGVIVSPPDYLILVCYVLGVYNIFTLLTVLWGGPTPRFLRNNVYIFVHNGANVVFLTFFIIDRTRRRHGESTLT